MYKTEKKEVVRGITTFNDRKDRYSIIAQYIILRRLRNEEDTIECLEIFNEGVSRQILNNNSFFFRNRDNVKSFFMYAKKCADEYWVKNATYRKATNYLPYSYKEYEYHFDYFGYNKYQYLTEDEFVIFFLTKSIGLNFRIISILLDLSYYSVLTTFSLARVKVVNNSK